MLAIATPQALQHYADQAQSNTTQIYPADPVATPEFQEVQVIDGDWIIEFDEIFGLLCRRNEDGKWATVARNDGMPNEEIE